MSRLSPVLSTADLPLAELHAARLDGELTALDACFIPVDVPATLALRAESLARQWPGRLIAEQHSAAWIWGAQLQPPVRHELCSSLGARARPADPLRVIAREVVINADEVVIIGNLRVTTPARTIADLARTTRPFTASDTLVIRALARIGGVTLHDCREALDRRRNLPNKIVAWQRITGALVSPVAV
ncbi:MAG: hypothetical protein ACOH1T_06775 [Microbacteriaceae bacterium]